MRLILISIVALLGVSLVAPISADKHDPIEDAIKARQGFMKMVSFNAGPLFGMAKGEVECDAELATKLAKNLHALTQMDNGAMWPEGSDNTKYEGKTRALPEAWTTYPKVAEAHQAWVDAIAALTPVAGQGLDTLKEKVGAVGKRCKGCHDDFRAEDF